MMMRRAWGWAEIPRADTVEAALVGAWRVVADLHIGGPWGEAEQLGDAALHASLIVLQGEAEHVAGRAWVVSLEGWGPCGDGQPDLEHLPAFAHLGVSGEQGAAFDNQGVGDAAQRLEAFGLEFGERSA